MANAYPDDNIAIIKYSYGGTNLAEQWAPTGGMYITFVETVEAGLAALLAEGSTYDIEGMLWVQGEADATGSVRANAYEDNLTELITNVRSAFENGNDFPFYIAGLSTNSSFSQGNGAANASIIREAQQAVASDVINTIYLDTNNETRYPFKSNDGAHYTYQGMISMGEDFADLAIAFEENDTTPTLPGFTPDPDKVYQITSVLGEVLAANGTLENPYGIDNSSSQATNTYWKFTESTEGTDLWYVERWAGGSLDCLSRSSSNGAMMVNSSTNGGGTWVSFNIEASLSNDDAYYLTLTNFNGTNKRLQLNNNGVVNIQPISFTGDLTSFIITEIENPVVDSELVLPEISITENGQYTIIQSYIGESDEFFIDGNQSISGLPSELEGAEIIKAFDDSYTVESEEGFHYFLALASYDADGFPEGHPGLIADEVEVAIEDAGVLNYYADDESLPEPEPLSLYKITHQNSITYDNTHFHHTLPLSILSVTARFNPGSALSTIAIGVFPLLTQFENSDIPESGVTLGGSDRNFDAQNFSLAGFHLYHNKGTNEATENLEEMTVDFNVNQITEILIAIEEDGNETELLEEIRAENEEFTINPLKELLPRERNIDQKVSVGFDTYNIYKVTPTATNYTAPTEPDPVDPPPIVLVTPDFNITVDIGVDTKLGFIGLDFDAERKCVICGGINIITPILLGFSEEETEQDQVEIIEKQFTNDPRPSDKSLENCLTSRPYVTYTSALETQFIINTTLLPGENRKIVWDPGKPEACIPSQESITSYSNSIGLPVIVGVLIDDDPMPSEFGWEELKDVNSQVVTGTHKLYMLNTSANNQLVQLIPPNALVWGSTADTGKGIVTLDELITESSEKRLNNTADQSNVDGADDLEVSEDREFRNMHLYPNPTTGKVTIKLTNYSEGQIGVFDIKGEQLEQLYYNEEHANTGLEVDLSTYQKGMYIIKAAQGDNTISVEKIIKE